MIDEELKKIWQGASEEAQIQFNKSKLLIEMEKQLKRFDEKIKQRNQAEIIAALMVIPIFSAFAYFISHPISRLGSGLIVVWSFFIILKLLYTRKQKPKTDFTTTLKHQLIAAKTYIEYEKRLLSTVLYWYLLPPFIGGILFTAGKSVSPWFLGFFILINILISVHIWRMNKRAVKRDMNPLIEQIETTLKELQS